MTFSLGIGLPDESFTVTWRAAAKGLITTADCPFPAVADNDIEPEPEEELTVSTATALVAVPALLVTIAVNRAPLSVAVVAGVV